MPQTVLWQLPDGSQERVGGQVSSPGNLSPSPLPTVLDDSPPFSKLHCLCLLGAPENMADYKPPQKQAETRDPKGERLILALMKLTVQ